MARQIISLNSSDANMAESTVIEARWGMIHRVTALISDPWRQFIIISCAAICTIFSLFFTNVLKVWFKIYQNIKSGGDTSGSDIKLGDILISFGPAHILCMKCQLLDEDNKETHFQIKRGL